MLVVAGCGGPQAAPARQGPLAGRTIRFRVFQEDAVEPILQYHARARDEDLRGGPWARPATRVGTLTFTTKARKVRKRVSVRFVRVA